MTPPPEQREPENPLHGRISEALARLGTLARATEQQGSTTQELSPLQARALVTLKQRGDLRVGEIAKDLMVTYGTISAALSVLEEKDLVRKFQDPDEHRAVRIELTRRGSNVARQAAGWNAEALQPAIASLQKEESATLLATLLKLILVLERDGVIGQARMCVSCKHFVPHGGNSRRPHYCGLLQAAIGDSQLRTDCADHDRAPSKQLGAVARAFRVVG
ncbi:MAG: MarR family winged helix-turn-helix transcriptional regulator [bacterium]|nr:MarR family winged helix-turn-helix transcriptional regulator [bacterium]